MSYVYIKAVTRRITNHGRSDTFSDDHLNPT